MTRRGARIKYRNCSRCSRQRDAHTLRPDGVCLTCWRDELSSNAAVNPDGEYFDAIGEKLGMSGERVRQVEAAALEKLRECPELLELWSDE